jgi:pimeloyl-ACP methyl ester carboxylesterase
VSFLKGLYFAGVFAKEVGDDTKQWAWQIALEAGPGADASLGALATLDQREAMSQIQVPALVFVGGQDAVAVPDIGRFAAQCLPSAKLVEMPDCGHGLFIEDPATYNRALLSFLAGL